VPRKNRFGLKLTELSCKSRASAKQSSFSEAKAALFVVRAQHESLACCYFAATTHFGRSYPKCVKYFVDLTFGRLFAGEFSSSIDPLGGYGQRWRYHIDRASEKLIEEAAVYGFSR
jgi:hypothetical protein